MRPLLFHLPLVGMLLILGLFALLDAGYLTWLRSESTFGWMVVVGYPVSALLGLTQIGLWVGWTLKRGIRSGVLTGRRRRILHVGLLIVVVTILFLFALGVARRWGLFE